MKIPPHIADTLTIRCIFCGKVHIKPVHPDKLKWITQPYPVLAMMIAGSGETVVPEGGKTSIVSKLWDPYYLPAHLMRRPAGTGPAGFRVLVLGFSVEVLGGIGLLDYFTIPLFFTGKTRERLKRLMLDLYDLKSAAAVPDLPRLAAEKKVLYDIFGTLITEAEPKKGELFLSTEESGCLPAVQYLKEHYADSLDVKKLREMCHLSQTHFFRLFKRLTGVSPFVYTKDRRIEEAQKLLVSSDLSVAEIGERVGWPDQFHFSRTFKSRTGYSPQQYRMQYQPGLKI